MAWGGREGKMPSAAKGLRSLETRYDFRGLQFKDWGIGMPLWHCAAVSNKGAPGGPPGKSGKNKKPPGSGRLLEENEKFGGEGGI